MSATAELAALLKAPQAGLWLIHLHLGRLQTAPSAEQRQSIRQLLRTLGKQADAWRLFDMANGDLLMLYQGLAYSSAEAACRQIAGLLPDSALTGLSPYNAGAAGLPPAGPLYDIIQLTDNTGPVLRYLEAAGA